MDLDQQGYTEDVATTVWLWWIMRWEGLSVVDGKEEELCETHAKDCVLRVATTTSPASQERHISVKSDSCESHSVC